jgi:hypothetical protein
MAQPPFSSTRRRAALALLAAMVTSVALAAPAVAQGATSTTSAPPSSTTTTTIPLTTTTGPPATTTTTIGTGPATTVRAPTTTSTTAPGPTTTVVDPAKLADLLKSLNADLARMSVVQAFIQAKAAVAGGATSAAAGASAAAHDAVTAANAALVKAASDELAATAAKKAAQSALSAARNRLHELAVAYYVHADIAVTPTAAITSAGSGTDRSVMLALLLPQERDDLAHAARAMTKAGKDQVAAKTRADRLVTAQAAAIAAAAVEAAALLSATSTTTTTSVGPPATVASPSSAAVAPGSGRPPLPYGASGLSILGHPAMTAGELAAWYVSTGHQPALTVPLATLTDLYQASGATYRVRNDIAFTQSIIETGYFGFPSGGQVRTADNNFAGIGACDSCHGGNGFPDAKSGVAAQLQLLHNYASSPPLPGPLPLTAGPTGCCPTWMSLTGVWATNPSYGFTILTLYKHILEWVLPRRTAGAGL